MTKLDLIEYVFDESINENLLDNYRNETVSNVTDQIKKLIEDETGKEISVKLDDKIADLIYTLTIENYKQALEIIKLFY